jgi:DNA-binding response OmpR family regulator
MALNRKKKIFIVDDEKDLTQLIDYNLRQEGFDTIIANEGKDVIATLKKKKGDLMILDIMLPDLSGIEICKLVRSDNEIKDIPIIMLSAKGEEIDRILGLELGADDYVTKPFSVRELVMRIKSLLKRVAERAEKEDGPAFLKKGSLEIDLSKHKVFVDKKEIILTVKEFELLKELIQSKGRVKTRDGLLNYIWGYDSDVFTRTIDTHITRLREKLGSAGKYIETVRGIGYRFKE